MNGEASKPFDVPLLTYRAPVVIEDYQSLVTAVIQSLHIPQELLGGDGNYSSHEAALRRWEFGRRK